MNILFTDLREIQRCISLLLMSHFYDLSDRRHNARNDQLWFRNLKDTNYLVIGISVDCLNLNRVLLCFLHVDASPKCVSENEDDGSPITIHRLENAPEGVAIFEVGLGILNQHTIYSIQFCLPSENDEMTTDEVEVIHSSITSALSFRHPCVVHVELIEYMKADKGMSTQMSAWLNTPV